MVIAGRDLGFLWILAQTRLLSTSQGKCTDSLIYAPTFCWDLMNSFMTRSFSSSTCWPHCTAIIAQQMCMAMGHPADDKRCADRSDSAFLSFLLFPGSPSRKHCQWQGESSCSSSVNWTFFLAMFFHFREVNQPMRGIAASTRQWLRGKGILGKLTHFACCWVSPPCLKCLCWLQNLCPTLQQGK